MLFLTSRMSSTRDSRPAYGGIRNATFNLQAIRIQVSGGHPRSRWPAFTQNLILAYVMLHRNRSSMSIVDGVCLLRDVLCLGVSIKDSPRMKLPNVEDPQRISVERALWIAEYSIAKSSNNVRALESKRFQRRKGCKEVFWGIRAAFKCDSLPDVTLSVIRGQNYAKRQQQGEKENA
ncbi:hypothetical protein FIBSPDRAFT_981752 [Athelia psychrophila]|uniref:Uncharacterized protein n=1 Tax=Athelia psychrophila TaxID=1759441 RepID=A0A166CPH4_9AGAM|nr:hypothetical protein FIBSPDRAFT_981752 [Fibularhizoctonia sp. CBS 109695]